MAEREWPWWARERGVMAIIRAIAPWAGRGGAEGGSGGAVAQPGPDPRRRRHRHGRGRRGPVPRVVAGQVGADLPRIGPHPGHQEHAGQHQERHQPPGDGDHREAGAGPRLLRRGDQERAPEDAQQGAGHHVAQALRPARREVHVRGRQAQLLPRADPQPEDEQPQDEQGQGAGHHAQPQQEGPQQAHRLPGQDAGHPAPAVGQAPDGIRHQEAAHPQQTGGQPGQSGRATELQHHQRPQAGHHLRPGTDDGLGRGQQERVAAHHGRDAGRGLERVLVLRRRSEERSSRKGRLYGARDGHWRRIVGSGRLARNGNR